MLMSVQLFYIFGSQLPSTQPKIPVEYERYFRSEFIPNRNCLSDFPSEIRSDLISDRILFPIGFPVGLSTFQSQQFLIKLSSRKPYRDFGFGILSQL